MVRRRNNQAKAIGIAVTGDQARVALLSGESLNSTVERLVTMPWYKSDPSRSLHDILKETAPGNRPKRIRLGFALGDPHQTVEVRSFPLLERGDFQKAALWHLRKNRRTFLKNPCFGAWLQRVREGSRDATEGVEGVLIEANGDEVVSLTEAGRKAGFKDCVVIPKAYSLKSLGAGAGGEERNETELLLLHQDGKGTLVAHCGSRLLVYRSVDLEPDPFDIFIADRDVTESAGDGSRVATMAEPRVRISVAKLLTEIERTEQYLGTRFHLRPASVKILDRDDALGRTLATGTGLSVSSFTPPAVENVEWDGEYLVAYGAARKALEKGEEGRLPQKGVSRRKKRAESSLSIKKIGSLLVRVLPLVLAAWLATDYGVRRVEKGNGEMRERLKSIARESLDPELESRLASWERKALTTNRFRSFQHRWSETLVALSALIPPGVVLDNVTAEAPERDEFEPSYYEYNPDEDPFAWLLEEPEEDETGPEFTIAGRTRSIDEVRRFVETLEADERFRAVTLLSAGREEDDPSGDLLFEIRSVPEVMRGYAGSSEGDD